MKTRGVYWKQGQNSHSHHQARRIAEASLVVRSVTQDDLDRLNALQQRGRH